MSATTASFGASIKSIHFYDAYTVHLGFVPNLTLKLIEFLLGNRFGHMLVLHHALDIQIFHDYSRRLGFHYLDCCLVKIIVANVGQLFLEQSNYVVLSLNVSALTELSFPYRTALPIITSDVGF